MEALAERRPDEESQEDMILGGEVDFVLVFLRPGRFSILWEGCQCDVFASCV